MLQSYTQYANVKIISELKNFLLQVASCPDLLDKFRNTPKDFSRTRKLCFERLVLFIINLPKKTLSLELEKFFEDMGLKQHCSVSAFSQQRNKLLPSFFHYWNEVLTASFYYYYKRKVKRWRGYRVIAADGSCISLINTPQLSSYFGGQRNQSTFFVQAKAFFHYDVLNELFVLSDIKPYRYGEMRMAYDAMDAVEEDMLMIYDRYYANYKIIALLQWQEKERKFVIRVKESLPLIRSFIESKAQSDIMYLHPASTTRAIMRQSGYTIDKHSVLKVRLVRVELSTGVEVLMTNLWEEEGYEPELFKTLYAMRWCIETNIGFIKNVLGLESFSGLSVRAVMQDFAASVFVFNLHALTIKGAQELVEQMPKERKHPIKVNRSKCYGSFKVRLVLLFLLRDAREVLKQLQEHYIRDPMPERKDRSYERKRKNPQSKSKHKTFNNYKPVV